MPPEVLANYLKNLVNMFFKILPIRESGEKTIVSYMESLQIELIGCSSFMVSINNDAMIMSLVSILQYLIDHDDDPVPVFKREVFKAISICNKLSRKYVDGAAQGVE